MKGISYIYSRILKKARGVALSSTTIDKTSKIEAGTTCIDTTMDRHSFCGYDCTFNNCDIGAFTSIASRVVVGGSMHPMHFVSTSPVFLSHKDSIRKKYAKYNFKDIPKSRIGNDVWIGEGVFIKSGVTIGDGAVIGMGSVVTKDVPAYAIFAGNPAKLIRFRFEDSIVKELVDSQWWHWDDRKLVQFSDVFDSPTKFIERLRIDN